MKGNEVTDITLVESKHNELHDAFLEIFQGRSDFQLENFVVNALLICLKHSIKHMLYNAK